MLKYEAVYFVGDNQVINRIRVGSFKTRNRGAFSGSLAALQIIEENCSIHSLKANIIRPYTTVNCNIYHLIVWSNKNIIYVC